MAPLLTDNIFFRHTAVAALPVTAAAVFALTAAVSGQSGKSSPLLRSVNAPAPAVGFSAEPKLVAEGAVELPLQLLFKKGISGVVTVEVDIDQQGKVERCAVQSGIDPLLDTLICNSMMRSLFTPAYEEGKAVASTVSIHYTFDPETVVRNSAGAVPEVRGVVLERQTSIPVKNAGVNLEVVDSLADRDMRIPMGRYLRLIGGATGQTENNGILSTATDSLGCFAFRLLPSCPVRLAIIAPGYEIAHASIDVQPGMSKKVTCRLEYFEKDTATEIVVYGTPIHRQHLDIEEEQVETGLTHYLSSLLQTKATVRSVPESRSSMMVRAGSPFDNRYYICGVQFLAPYHFGGHSYADIDGMMISALSEIDLTIDRIAGRQIDASGFRIDAQPGIYRPANRTLLKRPEISVDLNNVGQDILVSLPRRQSDDCLQLGVTRAENYTLKFLNSRRTLNENSEYSNPASYGNITLTGSGTLKSLQLHSFSWFAWDTYRWYAWSGNKFIQKNQRAIPWGMVSVTARPENRKMPLIRAGGSFQYFANGKRYGSSLYKKHLTMSNGVLSFAYDSLINSIADVSLEFNTEYTQWDGSAERTFQALTDSMEKASGARYYMWKDTALVPIDHALGNEYSLQMHATISKAFGPFTASADLLGAGLLYGKEPDAIGDAGVSLVWQGKHLQAGLHGGRITSRPDIRGLPDSRYRRVHSSTYLFSLPLFLRCNPAIKFGLQPYVRSKKHEPKLDPVLKTWIPGGATALLAAGVDLDAELQIFKWLAVNSAANFSHARRSSTEGTTLYEWDVPWGGRTNIHLQFGKENQVHIYCIGVLSEGLPVEDIYHAGITRIPDYRRIDLSLQYRSRIIEHRFLTRYDAYFNFFNLTGRYNATDYYRDESMQLRMIPLGEMFCELGVRFGFRL
ncbi:MAG: energy transducer TonB [Chitinispirillaceae bacterium]|nr:energy transducer TonB [Chitinispirillaceae bacterium]